MGDIIETTITAYQPFLYYEVTGNGMWLDVKTHSRALVGLAKQACAPCQYWIEFCNPGTIIMDRPPSAPMTRTGVSFTLSEDNYSRFWLRWDSESVRVGVGENPESVIVYSISSEVTYVTFTTKDRENPCTYKFEVPPLRLKIPLDPDEPKITTGKLQWKQCDAQLPDDVVIGGYVYGEVVYIVRAHHRGSLTPGMFVPSKGLAFIPWGGSDNPTSNFEALCGFNLKWKPASEKKIPIDAFVAGYSEVNREPLYIGRALDKGDKIPGKVQISHGVCYLAHQGKEIAMKKFEVLTEPGLNAYSVNEFVGPCHDMSRRYHDYREDDDDEYEEEGF